ncbi:pH-response transcription factor [Zancudomyces culisetae]|uniref:pH-response transcription factor n=1 Tax=Zancudomyces culisetae TaxID=1213189 RepID=A0A1R1PSU8_ZANCU|nr:pH-response transcription factor [Zancudomyces culisetae]|eukprot:OMH83973.1 pH-response transcription factor [Zancudomyces culisetae]
MAEETKEPLQILECKWGHCTFRVDNDPDALYLHLTNEHVGRKALGNLCLECKWLDCNVKTGKRDHITSHLRVHIPLKPYTCEICNKAFKRPQDLKKHKKKHYFLKGEDQMSVDSHDARGNKEDPPQSRYAFQRKTSDPSMIEEASVFGVASVEMQDVSPIFRGSEPRGDDIYLSAQSFKGDKTHLLSKANSIITLTTDENEHSKTSGHQNGIHAFRNRASDPIFEKRSDFDEYHSYRKSGNIYSPFSKQYDVPNTYEDRYGGLPEYKDYFYDSDIKKDFKNSKDVYQDKRTFSAQDHRLSKYSSSADMRFPRPMSHSVTYPQSNERSCDYTYSEVSLPPISTVTQYIKDDCVYRDPSLDDRPRFMKKSRTMPTNVPSDFTRSVGLSRYQCYNL